MAMSAEFRALHNQIDTLEAQVESLKIIINKAHDVLMDAQPHIQQGIDHGDATAEFVDAHIDIAMSILGYNATNLIDTELDVEPTEPVPPFPDDCIQGVSYSADMIGKSWPGAK